MDMRLCRKCGELKPQGEFYVCHGYRENTCKACRKKESAEYFRANRDRINARRRENYANCESVRRRYREYGIRRKIEAVRSL